MPYIAPEVVAEAKRMDLLTYLRYFEPQELVHFSGSTYTTRTHDSLKISNGKWMWWSQGIGGRNALDYLVKVKGLSFLDAVKTIMGNASTLPIPCITQEPEKPKVLLLPDKSASNNRVTEYLFGRGIDYEIICDCIQNGLIYESLPYHNAVFVGRDESGVPRYAAYRATNSLRIMGDAEGSDKRFSFRLVGTDETEVHLFECAVDLLSFATLTKLDGGDWREKNLVSLAGVYSPKKNMEEIKIPLALESFLEIKPNIKRIVLHLDNDAIGRKATAAMRVKLSDRYEVVDVPPPAGKDFNDFLCSRLGINRNKERGYER